MKKILLILIILGGLYFLFVRSDSGKDTAPVQTGNFPINPENATFSFDDGSVTLSGGQGELEGEDEEESEFKETIELLPENASGDLNADGKDDSVLLLARSGGGSGVFVYIAAYISGPVNYKGTNAIFIGDRISPETVSILNGVVTFKWLDRKLDEPFAAEPTVPMSEQYIYKNGSFQVR
jgi:hypothetical protein